MSSFDAKKRLIEILDFYKYKLEHNLCTMEEIDSATKTLEENMNIEGSISDFSNFFGVSEQSIRTAICRRLLDKPKRKVMYPFHKFLKVVPDKWLNNK